MTSPASIIATQLAKALDAEDYFAARPLLHDDCVYTGGPDGPMTGADAIIESYRAHGAIANPRFDEIVFRSEIQPVSELEATIRYLDRLRLGDAWHDHYCHQHIRIDDNQVIVKIRHENLPGELEALHAFEAEHRGQAQT